MCDDCRRAKPKKSRKPRLLRVKLAKIGWFGVQQVVLWMRNQGLMTEELEGAAALLPQVAPALDDVRVSMLPESRRPKDWDLFRAWWKALEGDIHIDVPVEHVKPMAALLRAVGFAMTDTQRASTLMRRADALEEVDVLDLLAKA